MTQPMDYTAMLGEAQTALEELSTFTEQGTQLRGQLEKMEKDLDAEERAVRTAVDSAAADRRGDLEKSFDDEITTLQQRLDRERASRDRAKTQGMEERIRQETAPLIEENQSLGSRLKTLYKAQKVPFFCQTNFFYAMYFPRTFREIFTFLLMFVIFFAAIPLGTWYFLLPERKTLYLVLIRAERDDKVYHLESYDREIADIEHDLGEITARKKEALSNFEKETRKVIEDEISAQSREKIAQLKEDIAELRGRVNYTEKVIKDRKIDIADRYDSYVGRDFMTKERLKELESILAGGEAANISEAREVYYEKNRNKR